MLGLVLAFSIVAVASDEVVLDCRMKGEPTQLWSVTLDEAKHSAMFVGGGSVDRTNAYFTPKTVLFVTGSQNGPKEARTVYKIDRTDLSAKVGVPGQDWQDATCQIVQRKF